MHNMECYFTSSTYFNFTEKEYTMDTVLGKLFGPTNIISTCGNKRPQALTITWASEV